MLSFQLSSTLQEHGSYRECIWLPVENYIVLNQLVNPQF